MADFNARIKPKRSTVSGEVPGSLDLEVGEIAISTADAKLFTKHSDGTIKEISGTGGGGTINKIEDIENVAARQITVSGVEWSTQGDPTTGSGYWRYQNNQLDLNVVSADGTNISTIFSEMPNTGTLWISFDNATFTEVAYTSRSQTFPVYVFFQLVVSDPDVSSATSIFITFDSPYRNGPSFEGDTLQYDATDDVWRPTPPAANTLDNLTDVDAATPADGQALVWSTDKWEPGSPSSRIQDAADFELVESVGQYFGNTTKTSSNVDTAGQWRLYSNASLKKYLIFHIDQLSEMEKLEAGMDVVFEAGGLTHTTQIKSAAANDGPVTKSLQIEDEWPSGFFGLPDGTSLTINASVFSGLGVPLQDGDQLRWDDTDGVFRPFVPNMEDLGNVAGTATDGQVLTYDASLGLWTPGTVSGSGSALPPAFDSWTFDEGYSASMCGTTLQRKAQKNNYFQLAYEGNATNRESFFDSLAAGDSFWIQLGSNPVEEIVLTEAVANTDNCRFYFKPIPLYTNSAVDGDVVQLWTTDPEANSGGSLDANWNQTDIADGQSMVWDAAADSWVPGYPKLSNGDKSGSNITSTVRAAGDLIGPTDQLTAPDASAGGWTDLGIAGDDNGGTLSPPSAITGTDFLGALMPATIGVGCNGQIYWDLVNDIAYSGGRSGNFLQDAATRTFWLAHWSQDTAVSATYSRYDAATGGFTIRIEYKVPYGDPYAIAVETTFFTNGSIKIVYGPNTGGAITISDNHQGIASNSVALVSGFGAAAGALGDFTWMYSTSAAVGRTTKDLLDVSSQVDPSEGDVLIANAEGLYTPGAIITKAALQTLVADSTDFADFQSKIAAL